MSTKPRILFMGTPEFAVHILDRIVQADHQVVGVVTVPDKPAGRGQKMHSSAVAKYAKKKDLKLLQPAKLKATSFLQELQALNIDIAVVVAFRMLPKVVWQLPKLGTFNLHASLLPNYRGAAPINWAVINGEKSSGVTTFLIDEKIDTGNILLQKSVEISPNDTAGILHDNLMKVGADLVLQTIDGLAQNEIIAKPQKESPDLKPAPKIFKEDTQIDWNKSLQEIHNLIRGMSPYPAAWTTISTQNDDKMLKIFSSEIEKTEHDYKAKTVFKANNKLGVAHPEGIIWLNEVQIEGKRRMKSLDFMNGYTLDESSQMIDGH